MRAVAPALLISLTLAASAAGAQVAAPVTPSPTADDPIGELLGDLPPNQSTDMDAEAAPSPSPIPVTPTPSLPVAVAPMTLPPPKPAPGPAAPTSPPVVYSRPAYAPPAPPAPLPTLDRPVMIDEVGRSPDAPPREIDRGYDSRIRSSFQSAQGLQGPLDGGWTVRAHDGAGLFSFQLVDRGYGNAAEGAWRALGGGGKVGLIDSIDRQPTILTIRITRAYGKPTMVLTLSQTSDGGWVGNLADETGTRAVTMRRD